MIVSGSAVPARASLQEVQAFGQLSGRLEAKAEAEACQVARNCGLLDPR